MYCCGWRNDEKEGGLRFLHCFSTAAAAAAAVGGAASFCTYSLQNFLFHFPFDEIYRRLFFSLSGVLFPRD